MTDYKLAKALDHIDEELITEALEAGKKKGDFDRKTKIQGNKILKAACVCILSVVVCWRLFVPAQSSHPGFEEDPTQQTQQNHSGIMVSENGVTIPPMEVTLSESYGHSASMIGFFIYQDRCYVHYIDIYEDVDLIDRHLGTITGMIDEWTPKDGYVNYAGSAKGEFYSVNGFDPSFMLCMKREDGAVSLFINNTGITLKYGAELFEERLHVSEKITAFQYETNDSWYYSRDQLYDLDVDLEIISELIQQMDEATFILTDEILTAADEKYLSSLREYILYFRLENGASVNLTLYQGGYVDFWGLDGICVKIPEETYEKLKTAFTDGTGTPATFIPDRMGATQEECRQDPQLGNYVPTYVPPQVEWQSGYIHYDIDPLTGQEIRTRELSLQYQSPNVDEDFYHAYSIHIFWTEDHKYTGWLTGTMTIEPSEVNLETIKECMKPYSRNGQVVEYGGELHMRVHYDKIMVGINSWGIDEESVLKILQSINK